MREKPRKLCARVDERIEWHGGPSHTNLSSSLYEAFNSKVKLVRAYDIAEDFAEAMNSERKVNPPPSKEDNEGIERLVRMTTIFQSPAFQNPRPRARSVDYMVCPCHEVRLEERKSQKGCEYVKCPMHPCLLFCAKEIALDYMREVYRQPHPDVCDMWRCLLCFCREPTTLQLSQSQDNPNRLFLSCSKKMCNFFWWADKPLGQKYWKCFQKKEEEKNSEHPLPTRDADGYPLRGYDIPGPPPRVRRKEDVERERPLTDYENQLLREIQELKSRRGFGDSSTTSTQVQ